MTKSLGTVHSKLAAVKGAEPEMREVAKDQLLLALHKAENEETAVGEGLKNLYNLSNWPI